MFTAVPLVADVFEFAVAAAIARWRGTGFPYFRNAFRISIAPLRMATLLGICPTVNPPVGRTDPAATKGAMIGAGTATATDKEMEAKAAASSCVVYIIKE